MLEAKHRACKTGDGEELYRANFVCIFGKAREGKSTLMNVLAQEDGIFQISNKPAACTFGCDISTFTSTLQQYGGGAFSSTTHIAYVDVEGQGDQDEAYDMQLVVPLLLMAGVVLFNWKGGVQKTTILSMLGTLARAAKTISDDSNGHAIGHLHIVFRDYQYAVATADDALPDEEYTSSESDGEVGDTKQSTRGATSRPEDDVYKLLLDAEANPDDKGSIRDLNDTRTLVLETFASVRVVLLPQPNMNGTVLLKKLTFADMSDDFTTKVNALRAVTAEQLKEPRSFGGIPLTFGLLPDALKAATEAMNKGSKGLCPTSLMHQHYAGRVQEVMQGLECEVAGIVARCAAWAKPSRNTATRSSTTASNRW
jgi:hypothetical protein